MKSLHLPLFLSVGAAALSAPRQHQQRSETDPLPLPMPIAQLLINATAPIVAYADNFNVTEVDDFSNAATNAAIELTEALVIPNSGLDLSGCNSSAALQAGANLVQAIGRTGSLLNNATLYQAQTSLRVKAFTVYYYTVYSQIVYDFVSVNFGFESNNSCPALGNVLVEAPNVLYEACTTVSGIGPPIDCAKSTVPVTS